MKSQRTQELRLCLGVALSTSIGHEQLIILPFEATAIGSGLALSATKTGMLMTLGLGCYALTNILLVPIMSRLSPRRVAMAGSALAFAATVLLAFTTKFSVFALFQALAGIGFGAIFASGNASGTGAAEPERGYSLGMGVAVVFGTLLPILVAQFPSQSSIGSLTLLPQSVFLIMSGFVALMMLPTLLFLPKDPPGSCTAQISQSAPKMRSGLSIAAVAIMTFFSIGGFSVYTLLEGKALSLLMNVPQVGTLIGLSDALSLTGTIASTWLGRRYGLKMPLVLSLLAEGLLALAIGSSRSPLEFTIATIIFIAVWNFVYPYIMGLGATLDPAGRLATALGAAYLVGSSVAATEGGILLQAGGFILTGAGACVLCATAATIGLIMKVRTQGTVVIEPPCTAAE